MRLNFAQPSLTSKWSKVETSIPITQAGCLINLYEGGFSRSMIGLTDSFWQNLPLQLIAPPGRLVSQSATKVLVPAWIRQQKCLPSICFKASHFYPTQNRLTPKGTSSFRNIFTAQVLWRHSSSDTLYLCLFTEISRFSKRSGQPPSSRPTIGLIVYSDVLSPANSIVRI
jgi:hypothetical protein